MDALESLTSDSPFQAVSVGDFVNLTTLYTVKGLGEHEVVKVVHSFAFTPLPSNGLQTNSHEMHVHLVPAKPASI